MSQGHRGNSSDGDHRVDDQPRSVRVVACRRELLRLAESGQFGRRHRTTRIGAHSMGPLQSQTRSDHHDYYRDRRGHWDDDRPASRTRYRERRAQRRHRRRRRLDRRRPSSSP